MTTRWFLVLTDDIAERTVATPYESTPQALEDYRDAEFNLWADGEAPFGKRVCAFRADSIDTIRQTHGNWFHDDLIVMGAA